MLLSSFNIFYNSLIFFFTNVILFFISFNLCFNLLKFNSFIDNLIATLILYLSFIIFPMTILGFFCILTFENTIIIISFICLIGFFILNKNNAIGLLKFPLINLKFRLQTKDVLFFVIFSIAISVILQRFIVAITSFSNDMDSFVYHIPLSIEWMKSKSIFSNKVFQWWFPGFAEMFNLWLIIAFNNDIIIGLQNWPAFIILILSIYSISRKIEISMKYSFYTFFIFLSVFPVTKQLRTQENDVFLVSFFLAAINFIFGYLREGNNKNYLFIFVTCLTFCFGTKYIGLLYSVYLMSVFLISIKLNELKCNNFKKKEIIIYGIIIMSGIIWYIRNYLITNNPLFPLKYFSFGNPLNLYNSNQTFNPITILKNNNYSIIQYIIILVILSKKYVGFLFLLLPIFFINELFSKNKNILYKILLSSFPVLFFFLIIIISSLADFEYIINTLNHSITKMNFGQCCVRYGLPFFAFSSIISTKTLFRYSKTKWNILIEILLIFNFFYIIPIKKIEIWKFLVGILLSFFIIKIYYVNFNKNISNIMLITVLIIFFTISVFFNKLIIYKNINRGNLYGMLFSTTDFAGKYSYGFILYLKNVIGKKVYVLNLPQYLFYNHFYENEIVKEIKNADFLVFGMNLNINYKEKFPKIPEEYKKYFVKKFSDDLMEIYQRK